MECGHILRCLALRLEQARGGGPCSERGCKVAAVPHGQQSVHVSITAGMHGPQARCKSGVARPVRACWRVTSAAKCALPAFAPRLRTGSSAAELRVAGSANVLRPYCRAALAEALRRGIPTHVLSVNWSDEYVSGALGLPSTSASALHAQGAAQVRCTRVA